MPDFAYECHACCLDFNASEPRLEEQPCPECGADEVYRDFGSPQVILRGEGWTPTFHKPSTSEKPLSPASGGSTSQTRVEAGGSDSVDADGDSIWRPTNKVMRRQLRKMGSPTQAKDVDRAQDQIRRTERDANEAKAILQKQKAAKSEQARKSLEEKL